MKKMNMHHTIWVMVVLGVVTVLPAFACKVLLKNDSQKTIWVIGEDKGLSTGMPYVDGTQGGVPIEPGKRSVVQAPGFVYQETGDSISLQAPRVPGAFYIAQYKPISMNEVQKKAKISDALCTGKIIQFSKIEKKVNTLINFWEKQGQEKM